MNEYLKVSTFQGYIQEGNARANLDKILEQAKIADRQGADIICFPETYLHGYFKTREEAYKHAIDLNSPEFNEICAEFADIKQTTVIFGLNELDQDKIFNTVVILEKGKCIGKYRKAYTYSPYDFYSLGRDFPVFEKNGVKYAIIICVDSAFREPAFIAALKGARILFCPSFNRVEKDARMLHYLNRKGHFISRSFDNHCWLVASDIIWDSEDEVCEGYTCIFNDDGELVTKSEPFQEMILTYSIPLERLMKRKKVRLFGNPELFDIAKKTYDECFDHAQCLSVESK